MRGDGVIGSESYLKIGSNTPKKGSKTGHFGVIFGPIWGLFQGLDLADTPDFLYMVDQTGRGLRSRTYFGPILDPFWGHFGVHFGGSGSRYIGLLADSVSVQLM